MNFSFWDFSSSSNMFSPTQGGNFSSNVSSYFRKPLKVVKSSSRNNSPRTSSRRRMTTTGHAPSRTRSVVDHQRASMPHLSGRSTIDSRPISWHPNMMDDLNQYQMLNDGSINSFVATPYSTVEINGLVTPVSYPVMDEPQIQELITPLEGLSAGESDSVFAYGQDFHMTQYWLAEQAKDVTINFDPSSNMMMSYPMQWYPTQQEIVPTIPTAPTSPCFMPLSSDFDNIFEAVDVPKPQAETEELVGMGLYDSPAQIQSSSLLLGSISGNLARRSLKLEDSFEPSPVDDAEDNNSHESEEEEEEEEEEDGVASEEDDINEPGVQPMGFDHFPQPVADAISATGIVPLMDNSYMADQWHLSNQGTYGWI